MKMRMLIAVLALVTTPGASWANLIQIGGTDSTLFYTTNRADLTGELSAHGSQAAQYTWAFGDAQVGTTLTYDSGVSVPGSTLHLGFVASAVEANADGSPSTTASGTVATTATGDLYAIRSSDNNDLLLTFSGSYPDGTSNQFYTPVHVVGGDFFDVNKAGNAASGQQAKVWFHDGSTWSGYMPAGTGDSDSSFLGFLDTANGIDQIAVWRGTAPDTFSPAVDNLLVGTWKESDPPPSGVPEPATWVLLALGVFAAGTRRRRAAAP